MFFSLEDIQCELHAYVFIYVYICRVLVLDGGQRSDFAKPEALGHGNNPEFKKAWLDAEKMPS